MRLSGWPPNLTLEGEEIGMHGRENLVRTKGEGGHLPSKERGLRRNQTNGNLDLGLLAFKTLCK